MSAADHLAAHLERHLARRRRTPITTDVEVGEIRSHLRSRYSFGRPLSTEQVIDDVGRMLWRWSEHATNPAHFGLFRPNIDFCSVAADALAAAYDPNLATYDFSPAAQEIEHHVLELLAGAFGLPEAERFCNFTSGGQEANHTAVAVALTHQFPGIAESGLRTLRAQPVFYLSQEGHHSFEKVAHSTGLGRRAVRWIPAGDDLRIDLAALENQIHTDRAAGLLPFLVVGTAGTTSAGVIDPLPELAALARSERLYFHVDAAWGGAVALSAELRPLLQGIENADSITCDAHKWFSVATGTGMFFCRHSASVQRTFGVDSAYVPTAKRAGTDNPLATTMQWSRRFTGLKLFMAFAHLGIEGVAARIERQTELGNQLRNRLAEHGFRILNPTPLPVVCFTHPSIEAGRVSTARIVRTITERQIAWISKTLLRGRDEALRTCISNFDTNEVDLQRLLTGLVETVEGQTEWQAC